MDEEPADGSRPYMPGTDIPGTDIPGTDIPGTDIPGADIPGTDIPGTDIPGTDIPGTDIPGTDIPGTDIPGTDIPGAEEPEPLSSVTDATTDRMPLFVGTVTQGQDTRAVFSIPGAATPWVGRPGDRIGQSNFKLDDLTGKTSPVDSLVDPGQPER